MDTMPDGTPHTTRLSSRGLGSIHNKNNNNSSSNSSQINGKAIIPFERPHMLFSTTIDNDEQQLKASFESSDNMDTPQSYSVVQSLDIEIFNNPLFYPTASDVSMIKFMTDTKNKETTNKNNLRSNNKGQLMSATVTALIVELTSPKTIDYQFLLDFFLTYRLYLKTETLLTILLTRFLWAFSSSVNYDENNNKDSDQQKIEVAKLVLIRTFVTIRHWLLNYFQDDFVKDINLRSQFVNFLNELSDHTISLLQTTTNQITKTNVEIASRVIIEMKKVYINLCSVYWSTIPLEHIKQDELLSYPLNPYEHMNYTRLSVLGLQQIYDPSIRRLSILSLYNKKTIKNESNPLLQNKGKNLAKFLHHNNGQQQKKKVFEIYSDNDQHFLHPKDSLVSLNKSYKDGNNYKTPLKPTITNIIKQEVSYTPLDGVKRLSKNELDGDDALLQLNQMGFTTNGNIKVFTDPYIDKIVPITPNKKETGKLKKEKKKTTSTNPPISKPAVTKQKPTTTTSNNHNTSKHQVKSNSTNARRDHKKSSSSSQPPKEGLARILQKWKRHFHKHKQDNKELSPLIDKVVNIIEPVNNHGNNNNKHKHVTTTTAKTNNNIQKNIKTNNNNNNDNNNNNNNMEPTTPKGSNRNSIIDGITPVLNLDMRVDVLSARIIEEFQFLLNDQAFKSRLSRQLLDESENRKSVFSLLNFLGDDDENSDNKSDIDMENTFEISPTKKKNRDGAIILGGGLVGLNEDVVSFKAPSVSFNWTDSFNDVSQSDHNGKVDDVIPSMINELKIDELQQYSLDDENDFLQNNFKNVEQEEDQFNFNPTSQQQRISLYSSKSYISYDSQFSRNVDLNHDNFSVRKLSNTHSSNNGGGSFKSYVTYDSALSLPNNDNITMNNGTINNGGLPDSNILKKKHPYLDLKIASPIKDTSFSPSLDHSTHMNISLDKSEYENIITLRELPYCLSEISGSRTNIVMKQSSSFFDLVKQYRLSLKDHSELEDSVISRDIIPEDLGSIESGITVNEGEEEEEEDDEDSIADYESTLSKIEVEDDINGEALNTAEKVRAMMDEDEKDMFGDEFEESESRVSMIPSIHSSSMIMPFPGLDSAAIAELAAIPDDTINDDPIEALLMKLEGKYVKHDKEEEGEIYYGLNDEFSQHDDDDQEEESIDEIKLQLKVRDLFITNTLFTPDLKPQQEQEQEPELIPNDNPIMIDDGKVMYASTPYDVPLQEDEKPIVVVNEEKFSLDQVLDNGTHVSFVLSYNSKHLAEQLTVIEKDALLEVDWKELIELGWQQHLEPINSWLQLLLDDTRRKGVNLVISRFNLLINWIISEILLTTNVKERSAVITRFIHIGQHCQFLQNYSTLMQILLALGSDKITILKETWKHVNDVDLSILQNLEKLSSPFKNFANLRIESRSLIPSKGCIPFLGLYLSDLTFNAERPNFFLKDDPNDSVTSMDRSLIEDFQDSSKLINFSKFRTLANVVRNLIESIEWSKLYTIKVDNDVVSRCLYIESLTEEEMSVCILRATTTTTTVK